MPFDRLGPLLGACALLWLVESRWPRFAFGRDRTRHVLPNLVLAGLTVIVNLGLATALRPAGREIWIAAMPHWLQAVLEVSVLDFFAWLSHVVLHHTAWGWRAHRVHHSEVAVDVTTALRQHPAETVWRIAWRLLPITTLGIPLPVVAIYETLSAANALLEHANIAVPARADAALRGLFVTPDMHKWHHSRDPRQTDTNYGNILSIWDRLSGMYTGPEPMVRLRYGLDGFDGANAQSLTGLLRMPLTR